MKSALILLLLDSVQNSSEDVEVLLAATCREKVEDRVAVAEAAGLKLAVMDIEAYAARRAINRIIAQLPRAGQGKMIGLFQISAQSTHVSALLDGQLIYEREQLFGSYQLTQDIVSTYGLSY